MSCERFREAITDHACGAPMDDAASSHLAGCAPCRQAFDEHRRLLTEADAELRQALALTPLPDFVARVTTRVRQAPHPPRWATWWWMGAAAAAALVAVGVSLDWPIERQRQAAPSPSVVSSAPTAPPRSPDFVERATPAPLTSSAARGSGRAAATRKIAAAPRPSREREPEVILPPTQAVAIARLRELVRNGVLDGTTLPAPSTQAELVIAPLTVPEIVVPDLLIAAGPGIGGADERE